MSDSPCAASTPAGTHCPAGPSQTCVLRLHVCVCASWCGSFGGGGSSGPSWSLTGLCALFACVRLGVGMSFGGGEGRREELLRVPGGHLQKYGMLAVWARLVCGGRVGREEWGGRGFLGSLVATSNSMLASIQSELVWVVVVECVWEGKGGRPQLGSWCLVFSSRRALHASVQCLLQVWLARQPITLPTTLSQQQQQHPFAVGQSMVGL
eukprot:365396-Chlamydomonas_euryale.AAC.27